MKKVKQIEISKLVGIFFFKFSDCFFLTSHQQKKIVSSLLFSVLSEPKKKFGQQK